MGRHLSINNIDKVNISVSFVLNKNINCSSLVKVTKGPVNVFIFIKKTSSLCC